MSNWLTDVLDEHRSTITQVPLSPLSLSASADENPQVLLFNMCIIMTPLCLETWIYLCWWTNGRFFVVKITKLK